jgi:Predicted phosphatases
MKLTLAVFDMDGTICDTSEGIFNSIHYVEKSMGLRPASIEQMRTHLGPPITEAYSKNYKLSGSDLERAVILHREYSLSKGLYESKVYDLIPELMQMLKKHGIKISIATLKNEDIARKIVKHHNLDQYIDFVFGALPNQKMNKEEIINKCIIASECEKSETILIGDSIHDFEGAKGCGIDFIAVTYGYGYVEATMTNDGSYIFCANSVLDLINYFRRLFDL